MRQRASLAYGVHCTTYGAGSSLQGALVNMGGLAVAACSMVTAYAQLSCSWNACHWPCIEALNA